MSDTEKSGGAARGCSEEDPRHWSDPWRVLAALGRCADVLRGYAKDDAEAYEVLREVRLLIAGFTGPPPT